MVLRKQVELDRFKEIIDRDWKLSIVEQDVLDSFLNLFLAGKNTEIKKVEHLLNDETEELLLLLNDGEIREYAEDCLDMIDKDDCEECDDCKDLDDYDDDDLLDECSRRDLKWEDYERIDIVTQSDLYEMTELFLNLSPQKRNEVINNLKNV